MSCTEMDEDVGHSGCWEEVEKGKEEMNRGDSGHNSWEDDSSSSDSCDEVEESDDDKTSVDKDNSLDTSQESGKRNVDDRIEGDHTSHSGSNSDQDSDEDCEDKEDDDEDKEGDDYDGDCDKDGNRNEDDEDEIGLRRKAKPRSKSEQKVWEENPDIYGIRRSSRQRKEPERLVIQSESDSDDSSRKRSKRDKKKREKGWIPTLSDSESEDSDSSYEAVGRRGQRMKPKAVSVRNQRGRNISTSSSDTWKPRNKGKSQYGGSRRNNTNKVSYKEDSEDDSTDSDDIIDGVEEGSIVHIAEDVETIEKVMRHRQGRLGEVGAQTTIYAVEAEDIAAKGDADPTTEETEVQFLIKWKGWSHLHNTWESKESLAAQKCNGMKKLENYIKKMEDVNHWKNLATPEDAEYYEYQVEMNQEIQSQYLKVERVIAHQFTAESTSSYPDYYCKWQGLAYADCTWEDGALAARFFQNEIDIYLERERSDLIPVKNAKCLRNRPKFVPFKSQPKFLGNGHLELRDYQLDGVNWLVHAWIRETSVILADEMGLGKTIQAISFLSCLFFSHSLYGPFLIVVPLSTLDAWQREFQLWCPDMNVIVYIGDVNSRTVVREHEWYLKKTKKIKFNVLITTYEILLRDKDLLSSLNWACLLVDEAHRLKNEDSLLYRILIDFHTNFRLLITGTPLQNSLKELWSLMHFIMPRNFQDWEHFDSQYSVSDKEGLQKLHRDLEPYLLRRVKKDVEKSLPSKIEQILRVEMSQVQKQYYKLILTKNVQELCKELKGSFSGLLNIIVELKKCCNHSHLIKPAETDFDDPSYLQVLIRGSGKMILLDKLLCRLKETGHRVLIFSQMVRLLDILADYLYLRKFQFQRLDGSIKGDVRQRALDHFNAEGSQDFCFLLSTRAGGLGINLASADTVIIFDSDWNPQNDLQAMARAHRIGQKNKVSIYRFVTKGSIEEDIIERAKKKMVLDHLIIQRMDTTGRRILSKSKHTYSNAPFNKEELSSILKFGAEELFKEPDSDSDQKLQAMDIDEILKRAETQDTQEDLNSIGEDLLSQFKVVNYASFAEEEIKQEPVAPMQKLWEEIIPEEERKKIEEELKEKKKVEMDLKPRSRKTAEKQKKEKKSKAIVDTESSSSSESEVLDDDEEMAKSKKSQRKKTGNKVLKKDEVNGFTDTEIRRFIKSYKKFARPMTRLDSIAEDAELNEKSATTLSEIAELIKSSCEQAVKEYQEKLLQDEQFDGKKKGATVRISGVTVNAPSVLKAEVDLEPLATCIPSDSTEQLSYRLTVPTRNVHWGVPWGVVEDSMLLLGMLIYGVGNWDAIKNDSRLQLTSKILPISNGKPQDKHLQSRADYLLKLLKQQSNDQHKMIPKKHKKSSSEQKPAKFHTETSRTGLEEKEQSVVEEEKVVKKRKSKVKEKVPKKERKREKKNTKGKVSVEELPTCTATVVDEVKLDEATFKECKEKMRTEKKSLQSLHKPDDSLSEKEQVQNTKRCLLKIGDHIEKCLDDYNNNPQDLDVWRNNLWSFVAKFTELGPSKLHKLYRTACRKRDAIRDEHKREIQKLRANYSNSLHEIGKMLPHDRLEMEEARKRALGIDTTSSSIKIPKLDRIRIPHKKKSERLMGDHDKSYYEDTPSHPNNDNARNFPQNRKSERNQGNENWNSHRHGEYRKSYRKGGGDERYHRANHSGPNDENSGSKIQTYREWKEAQNRNIPNDEKPQTDAHGNSKRPYRDKPAYSDERSIRKNGSGTQSDPRNRQRSHVDRHDSSDREHGNEYFHSPSYSKSPMSSHSTFSTEAWSRKRTLSNNSDASGTQLNAKQVIRDPDHSPSSNQSWPTSGGNT